MMFKIVILFIIENFEPKVKSLKHFGRSISAVNEENINQVENKSNKITVPLESAMTSEASPGSFLLTLLVKVVGSLTFAQLLATGFSSLGISETLD